MKMKKQLIGILLTLMMVLGQMPGMSLTAYALTSISETNIIIFKDSGTVSSDMTCTKFNVYASSTLTINKGVTLTLNCADYNNFYLLNESKMELHGILTGSVSNGDWNDRSYINVYLSDGAKYTVTGLSCGDGDNHLVYIGYDAATDGKGTVSVKNGSTNVTSDSEGYKTTTYTFTATPSDGYKFKNWTKGAGGEVLGTDASINVTCEQNGQYRVYANFERKTAQTITAEDVTATYGDTGKKIEATTSGDGALSYAVKSGNAVTVDASGNLTIAKAGTAVITVTAAETTDCAQATKDVTVTVNTKAMTVSAENVNVIVDGQPHGITVNVTDPATGYTVKYGTEAGSYTLDASPTQTEVGTKTVYYQVTADNYTTYTGSATVTVNAKQTQTITASDVTATYGDTGKSVSGTTSGDGAISYSVKSGDAVTVDENTGALTILKAGSAVITVTAAETATYAQATKDVNVTVNTKAMTVSAENVNVTVDGQPHGITVNVTDPASGATVKYGTEVGTYNLDASPTQTEAGELTVYYQVMADNYTTYTGSAKVTVNAKQTQTITASDVTATYGDTDKSVSGTTTGDGAISYSVKSGDAVTVDENTGALTILKAGSAVITVTAAETATYAQATKEVAVTINKAAPTVTAPTAKTLTYNGQKQELVNAGSTEDGTLYYAVTTENTAPTDENLYDTSIPTATNAGTYYVWYRVAGDENHTDTQPISIEVTISTVPVFSVLVTDDGNGTASANPASGETGTEVTLTAEPKEGYRFREWQVISGGVTVTDNRFRIGSANAEIRAVFEEIPVEPAAVYTVTVINDGNGTASANPASGETGTEVTLTAEPKEGYRFREWQVISGGVTVTENRFRIGSANAEIRAVFEEIPVEPVQPVTYATVSAVGVMHTIGSGEDAVIRVERSTGDKRELELFTGAAVDGIPVPDGSYSAAKGSLILTLKSAYLDTLREGEHKVTISFRDGSAETALTIRRTGEPAVTTLPKTGDSANPVLWLGMIAAGLAVAFAAGFVKKRRDR